MLAAGANPERIHRCAGTSLIPAALHGDAETVCDLRQTHRGVDHVNRLGSPGPGVPVHGGTPAPPSTPWSLLAI